MPGIAHVVSPAALWGGNCNCPVLPKIIQLVRSRASILIQVYWPFSVLLVPSDGLRGAQEVWAHGCSHSRVSIEVGQEPRSDLGSQWPQPPPPESFRTPAWPEMATPTPSRAAKPHPREETDQPDQGATRGCLSPRGPEWE